MSNSRVKNVILNSYFGVISQLSIIALNFITRTFFIMYLGKSYLGLNGLFTNILTLFSLAELGLGTAIVYSLYKPIAEKDYQKVFSYIKYYKKIYIRISLIVLLLGLIFLPFLNQIITEKDIKYIHWIFLIFLANSVCSYMYAHYRSLVIAHQKEFLISKIRLVLSFIKAFFQIGSLYFFQSFLLFLTIQVIITFLENLLVFFKGKNLLKKFQVEDKELPSIEKSEIWKNVKSLMLYKIGGTLLDTTDQIIISIFLGVLILGEVSNYILIISAVSIILFQIFNSITASVGNFIVKENKVDQKNLLYSLTLVTHFLYGFSFILLYYLVNPIIEIWIGSEYVIEKKIVSFMFINWYIAGMMNSIWIFRTNMGLFKYGQYRPIISAIINLILSLVGVKFFGLIGVFLATTITRLITNVWFDPLVVFKYGFSEKPYKFYYTWFNYVFITLVSLILSDFLLNLSGIKHLKYTYVFCGITINLIFFVAFTLILKIKSSEMNFFKNKFNFIFKK